MTAGGEESLAQAPTHDGPQRDTVLIFLLSSAACEATSIWVLWYFTTAWSDYAFIVLFCLAAAFLMVSGFEWVNQHFDAKSKALKEEDEANMQAMRQRFQTSVADPSRQTPPTDGDRLT